ncbi:hypothetical protein EON65_20885 [archaeon]|nr:MAG: hypothetical protein EON65_20885 [archaeon]
MNKMCMLYVCSLVYDMVYDVCLVYMYDARGVWYGVGCIVYGDVLNAFNLLSNSLPLPPISGSGKTFTMMGPPDNRGVNTRALEELFVKIRERSAEFRDSISVSILEVYNEEIRDLLGWCSVWLCACVCSVCILMHVILCKCAYF